MSKHTSEDIHQLIHALSKSEKRFFRLYSSRTAGQKSKKFIRLFECIEKQKTYNEEKILRGNRLFSQKQLPNLKLHLYKQVLKSLSIVNAGATVDIRIHYLAGQAQLLYGKCLYAQSLKILGKAKALARNNGRNILLLDILDLEKKIMLHTVSVRTRERISSITTEARNTSERIRKADTFSNLSLTLNSFYMNTGYIRNRADYLRVKNFFERSMPAHNEKQLSFHEKIYLYYCYTGYHFFTQDFQKAYVYCKKMSALFEQEPQLVSNNIEMYIKVLDHRLTAESKLYLYPEFCETHKKLVGLKRSFHEAIPENTNLNLFKTIYVHEINRHFMLGEFTRGTQMVGKLEKELERFVTRLDQHTILIFYYKIACLYFGASNFRKCLKWLNRIIQSKDIGLREDIHAFSRILSLICHYELGRGELLEYTIRSTYRFLLQKNDVNTFQKHILRFLRNLSDRTSEKELNENFVRLHKELLPLTKHTYEKRPFLYFDIISWLESRIQNKPVERIIRDKSNRIFSTKTF